MNITQQSSKTSQKVLWRIAKKAVQISFLAVFSCLAGVVLAGAILIGAIYFKDCSSIYFRGFAIKTPAVHCANTNP